MEQSSIDLMRDIRRRNLRLLAIHVGGQRVLAALVGVTEARISHLLSDARHRYVSEKFARRVEEALVLEDKWMDAVEPKGLK